MDTSRLEVGLQTFVDWTSQLRGDEKGEAQVFLEHLFQAFGHPSLAEIGAVLEDRVRGARRATQFADLVWRPRVLIEMKKRGERLDRHYHQAFEYWMHLVPNRPRYVILCNFDELWVFDFDLQLDDPVDVVLTKELPHRWNALGFLLPKERKPLFGNDRVAVTREAAGKVARVFTALIRRGEDRERAQRFILQCVVAFFSEDFGLLQRGFFSELLRDCKEDGDSFDLVGGLFRQMNEPTPARAGRYKEVPYFNGGLFAAVDPVGLKWEEAAALADAGSNDWSKVHPAIFGTLFQASMDQKKRHVHGAHFTSESDIQKVVLPTIVRPWRERIEAANSLAELRRVHDDLLTFKVLDPACGSGNFLYTAFRELSRLEAELVLRMRETANRRRARSTRICQLSVKQFHGFDIIPFAVEIAKVTMLLAKELSLVETRARLLTEAPDLEGLESDQALPLENLDKNIRCEDALFTKWPHANAIIGNPPYQSKNKMQAEYGRAYLNRLRDEFPEVPGRADYCVYFFRKAHDHLSPGGRAGLVGTNTIRQNYSREGGLDYIIETGGTIVEAVSTQNWSGDAAVHVSIVNWLKGAYDRTRRLSRQDENGEWTISEPPIINSSLSDGFDVSSAARLQANARSSVCFQGQTHGHAGFLLSETDAKAFFDDPSTAAFIHPYLIGDDLLGTADGRPTRYVIDLSEAADLNEAMRCRSAFRRIERLVLPDIRARADHERRDQGAVGPRQQHLQRWWRLWRSRSEMLHAISGLTRYVACSRVTKRPIFEFVSSKIRPNDALAVFAVDDDYSFGILQSSIHWEWFRARCSTLEERPRYTSDTVFDSFVWPQDPRLADIMEVANLGRALRVERRRVMRRNGWSLRELYRSADQLGRNSIREAQSRLDESVRAAYGMGTAADSLEFLLRLNRACTELEQQGLAITPPGLPVTVLQGRDLVSDDCIRMP